MECSQCSLLFCTNSKWYSTCTDAKLFGQPELWISFSRFHMLALLGPKFIFHFGGKTCACDLFHSIPPSCECGLTLTSEILIRLFFIFLWGNSKHWWGIKKLQAHTKRGWFFSSQFKWYYWAININTMRTWLPSSEASDKPNWFQTEVSGALYPWPELFGTRLLQQKNPPFINDTK